MITVTQLNILDLQKGRSTFQGYNDAIVCLILYIPKLYYLIKHNTQNKTRRKKVHI